MKLKLSLIICIELRWFWNLTLVIVNVLVCLASVVSAFEIWHSGFKAYVKGSDILGGGSIIIIDAINFCFKNQILKIFYTWTFWLYSSWSFRHSKNFNCIRILSKWASNRFFIIKGIKIIILRMKVYFFLSSILIFRVLCNCSRDVRSSHIIIISSI